MHDEVENLSGNYSWMLPIASQVCLNDDILIIFKKLSFDLNCPGFKSLRKFVVEEPSIMTSDYAQTFFKSNDKKLRESRIGHGSVRLQQIAVTATVV